MILKLIISKAYYSAKNIAGVRILIFYTSSDAALYLFHEKILYGIKVIVQTRFSLEKISKVHNFTKIIGRVTVLILCSLSDTSLFLHPVS